MADRHPAWCARGYRCARGEHRSEPVTIEDDITYTLVSYGRGVWVEYRGALLLEYGPEQAAALASALAIAVRAARTGDVGLLDGLLAIASTG